MVKTADWVVELGPEGGGGGGRLVAEGTPEVVAAVEGSPTGRALRRVLAPRPSLEVEVKKTGTRKGAKAKQTIENRSSEQSLTSISVRGARQHNLKGVDIDIPRHQMTVCGGPSGSGKSSFAIDTLYAEGQRRYVESLSSYARQFLAPLQKPKVESITGLSPAVCIEQKTTSKSPRSTVGTVTEIHDYWRVLFARLGQAHCPACGTPIGAQSTDEIVEKILHLPEGTKIYVMAPVDRRDNESYQQLWDHLRSSGFSRVRIDGSSHNLDTPPKLSHRRKHQVEVVVDRAIVRRSTRSRLADSVESALDLGKGVVHIARVGEEADEANWPVERQSLHRSCDGCGRSFEELSPHHFSFNSPLGWCPVCEGLGTQKGANPAILVPDGRKSLRDGAVVVWPRFSENPLFSRMIGAMASTLGINLDTPFDDLDGRLRRAILHGSGETWFEVPGAKKEPRFTFQYKGLFPAIEEAGRVSFLYRYKLQGMVDEVPCATCMGSRLRDDASAVKFRGFTLDQIGKRPLGWTLDFVKSLDLKGDEAHIAGDLAREIRDRLQFLVDVGLDYLTLARGTPTLSGGEAQRIRLASQIGSGLTGVLYVLDEPTIGLHPRDNARLLGALRRLRDLGNTLVLVEHDREVIEAADYFVDFGPGSGDLGGEVTGSGTPAQVKKIDTSLTGRYLSGKAAIPVPTNRRVVAKDSPALVIRNARHHNLKNIDVSIPLGVVTVVTGVSGSGKSSLVQDILMKSAAKRLHRAQETPGAHDDIEGFGLIDKVIGVDQSPLGSTPTSIPATYTGLFDLVRELYAKLPEAKVRGYSPRRFSFNQGGGRCEACEGAGQKRIEMHFLPDVWIECDSCHGSRFTAETLAVTFRGKSIADVLKMKVDTALEVFAGVPKIRKILQTLHDVGLGYLPLGQAAPTLSGGEAQRVKLAAELARPDTGRTLYILDEPTTGLHLDDTRKLMNVIHRLADLGNTVVIIEHNLEVIKTADWLIDVGPEAGQDGGEVVACGPPERVVLEPRSLTGRVLQGILAAGPFEERAKYDPKAAAKALIAEARSGEGKLSPVSPPAISSEARSPWEIDGRRWHTVDRKSRTDRAVNWEGEALAHVVDRVQSLGEFASIDWSSHRSTVKIACKSAKKSDLPFFQAMTGHEWVLKLIFTVRRQTFKQTTLLKSLGLRPFHELPTPVLSDAPRVLVEENQKGLQEVTIHVHSGEDVKTPSFEAFLAKAVASVETVVAKKRGKVMTASDLEAAG